MIIAIFLTMKAMILDTYTVCKFVHDNEGELFSILSQFTSHTRSAGLVETRFLNDEQFTSNGAFTSKDILLPTDLPNTISLMNHQFRSYINPI